MDVDYPSPICWPFRFQKYQIEKAEFIEKLERDMAQLENDVENDVRELCQAGKSQCIFIIDKITPLK